MSAEENETEALRKSLSNSTEELAIVKLELDNKATTLGETQNELNSLKSLVSESQRQSADVERDLLTTRAALVESEALVQTLNESLTENDEQLRKLQKVKDELMETQTVLGKHLFYTLFMSAVIFSEAPNVLSSVFSLCLRLGNFNRSVDAVGSPCVSIVRNKFFPRKSRWCSIRMSGL